MNKPCILAVVVLAGCATTASSPIKEGWTLNDKFINATTFTDGSFKGKETTYPVKGAYMRNVRDVLLEMRTQSGIIAIPAVVATDSPNAFATTNKNGEPVMALSFSMVDNIGGDKDALATTIGHELAHVKLNHSAIRKQRSESAKGAGDALGVVLGLLGVPMGGTIASVGVQAVTTAYSRDEEREADVLGLQWAMSAGYSACGAARTMRMLARYNSNSVSIPFLSTHPGNDERIDRANQASIKATGTGCG